MSLVSVLLESRRIDPQPTLRPCEDCSLAELDQGVQARIVGICDDADPATVRRLFDLGFAPGAEVQMVRRAPMSDPMMFRVAGFDIALRRAQARCVKVDPVR